MEEIFCGGSNWRHYFRSTMWDEIFIRSDKGDDVYLRCLPALSGSGHECLPGAFARTGALGYRVSTTWSCYCDGGLQCTPCVRVRDSLVHSPVSDVSCADQVNEEVARFTDIRLGAAREELPLVQHGRRPQYRDERLKALCRQSMEARNKWRENGCPTSLVPSLMRNEGFILKLERGSNTVLCSQREDIFSRDKSCFLQGPLIDLRFRVPTACNQNVQS